LLFANMCIIFLAPQCLSTEAAGQTKLYQSLGAELEIGRCVDPTSYSPIHCSNLEVRHQGQWYEKCLWCSEMAKQWREGKENQCAGVDEAEAKKLEERRSFESEILRREEDAVRVTHSQTTTKEESGQVDWTGRCCFAVSPSRSATGL
jgi:hypothetical protein